MTRRRLYWGLCIAFVVFIIYWFLYPRQEASQPETKISISDSLIAKTTKLIIRQAINYVDFDKMKNATIKRIKNKSGRSYHKEMDRIFDDIEFMGLTDTFGITRFSSREEVIKFIESTDKDTLLKKLDEIPDQAIARLIRKKLQEQKVHSIAELKDFLYEKIDRIVREVSG